MEQTDVWEISKEEAGQLSVLLEQCTKILAESNARSEQTFAGIAQLQDETEANLKQLRLAFEVQRNKDQQQYVAERAASERKMFRLQVENMILKADRQLELTSEQAAELEQMLAAMRKINEQMARDQAEIEVLQAETRAIIARLKERPFLANFPFFSTSDKGLESGGQ